MWIFSRSGFISVVAHTEKPEILLVRSRDEGSLLSLQEATGAGLKRTPANELPHRIEVPREALIAWVSEQISELNYSDYKPKIGTDRPEFDAALRRVWAAMRAVETPRVTQEDRDRAKKCYPKQTFSDGEIEMLKGLGHL